MPRRGLGRPIRMHEAAVIFFDRLHQIGNTRRAPLGRETESPEVSPGKLSPPRRDRRRCRIAFMTAPANPYRHHTHRLDLEDPSIREWAATVLLADPDQGIVLDRSAFYPGGGGQPPDHGVLLWGNVRTRIVGVRKSDDLYLLPAEGDPLPPAGTSVHGGLDDERRTSLMRTHSGLHVLSAIVLRDFGAPVTGGNMEPLIARMDFDLPDVPADFKQRVEDACNAAVRLNRPIDVRVLPREQAMAIPNIIRTASDLLPAGHRDGADRRHRRHRPPGRGRYARGLHGHDRPHRGDKVGEQGSRLSPCADPDRGRRVVRRASAPSGAAPRVSPPRVRSLG
jgi:misacylated tRNA(Ala) deacylase